MFLRVLSRHGRQNFTPSSLSSSPSSLTALSFSNSSFSSNLLQNSSSFSTSPSISSSPIRRRGSLLIPTTHEVPSDAVTISHQLLIRAGLIRRSSTGIYMLLPLAIRSLQKLSAIIDEEMQGGEVGGQKLSMPILLHSKLWKETGRWESSGKEMIKVKDRHFEDYCLGPTHEEPFTQLVAEHITSPKQLPLRLYQIGPKYRDEARPRSGLLRAREFWMKDMYSFDTTKEAAILTYNQLYRSYQRIFSRLGIKVLAAQADSGNIGGNLSHEFHLLAEAGEDVLLSCDSCDYVANSELAIRSLLNDERGKVASPEEVSVYRVTATPPSPSSSSSNPSTTTSSSFTIVIPKDREPNPIKITKALSLTGQDFKLSSLSSSDLQQNNGDLTWILDSSLETSSISSSLSTSASRVMSYHDLITARSEDVCGICHSGHLKEKRGIELGHVFYLGTKYSSVLGAAYTTQAPVESQQKGQGINKRNRKKEEEVSGIPSSSQSLMEMGCYGIGVTRILAATVEAHHDSRGIVWPLAFAPYKAVVLLLITNDPELHILAESTFHILESHPNFKGDVVLDDRDEKGAGYKMNEAELLGYPFIIVVGKSSKNGGGVVEVRLRSNLKRTLQTVLPENLPDFLLNLEKELQ